MVKKESHLDQLENILEKGTYSKLRPFKSPKKWSKLSQDEKELLGILFLKQAEHFLANGDARADESFDLAAKVMEGDSKVYFQQGVIYCNQGENRYLDHAIQAFSHATRLDRHYYDAWRGWAAVLFRKGMLSEDLSYFSEADLKFQEAERSCVGKSTDYEMYWQWGICWYQSGKLSGEAHDFSIALEKMMISEAGVVDDHDFWNDYGNMYAEQFALLGSMEHLMKSIEKYKKAVQMTPEFSEGWFNLGTAYHRLYESSMEEAHRNAASECYSNVTVIKPEHPVVWGKWGQLLAWSGKFDRRLPLLIESFEKFEKAIEVQGDHPILLASLAEALLLVGGNQEDLTLLMQAKEKLEKSVSLSPKDPDIWCLYGECFNELGKYFQEKEYFEEAIAKFQHGLTHQQTHYMLWFGVGLAHLAIGEMEKNKHHIEKAILFFSRVAEYCKDAPPLFWCQWGIAFRRLALVTNDRRYAEAALKKFEKAVHLFPQGAPVNADCLYQYGCMCDLMGDFEEDSAYYEKAIDILSQIVDQEPSYLPARHSLALSYAHLAESTKDIEIFGRAHEQFQHLLTQDPEASTAWNDWGYTLLTLSYMVNDSPKAEQTHILIEQAEKKLTQAAALGENQAYYNLACLYSLRGDVEKSIHFLERANQAGALPEADAFLEDQWLARVRKSNLFPEFLKKVL